MTAPADAADVARLDHAFGVVCGYRKLAFEAAQRLKAAANALPAADPRRSVYITAAETTLRANSDDAQALAARASEMVRRARGLDHPSTK